MSDEQPVEVSEARRRGVEMMRDVYGWDVGPHVEGRFVELTMDHLFGTVWAEGALSVRERRLVLLGLLVGSGLDDVVDLQLDCALSMGEVTPDELRELVVFLAHYAGWPRAAKLNQQVEGLIARQAKQHATDDGATSAGAADSAPSADVTSTLEAVDLPAAAAMADDADRHDVGDLGAEGVS